MIVEFALSAILEDRHGKQSDNESCAGELCEGMIEDTDRNPVMRDIAFTVHILKEGDV